MNDSIPFSGDPEVIKRDIEAFAVLRQYKAREERELRWSRIQLYGENAGMVDLVDALVELGRLEDREEYLWEKCLWANERLEENPKSRGRKGAARAASKAHKRCMWEIYFILRQLVALRLPLREEARH